MGQRTRTRLIVAAVAAVAALAAVDGLRGNPGPGAQPPPEPRPPAVRLPPLPPHALGGRLWYADSRCRVASIDLTTLRRSLVTRSAGHCRFWPSPDLRHLAMHVGRPFQQPAALELLDLRTGVVSEPFHRPDLAIAPPAWSPDSGTLVVCDGNGVGSRLLSLRLSTGRVRLVRRGACYPGYVGGRFAYRDEEAEAAVVGGRPVADTGSLGRLLHTGVDQLPGLAAQGGTLAVPATTIRPPAGRPPDTVIVFFDSRGRKIGRWNTGVAANQIGLVGEGRFAEIVRDRRLTLRRVRGGPRFADAQGPVIAAAAAPDGRTLALAGASTVVFAPVDGRGRRFSLPIATVWLQWTR